MEEELVPLPLPSLLLNRVDVSIPSFPSLFNFLLRHRNTYPNEEKHPKALLPSSCWGILTSFPFNSSNEFTFKFIPLFIVFNESFRIDSLETNYSSFETILNFGLDGSHIYNYYYNQDLH